MSSDEAQECPLCMEVLELDDINFYPCKCEYQICRFCWHRLRTDENGLCPACRAPYPEDPVNFKPLSVEELTRIKSEKRAKHAQQKHSISESRKHLANLRVIQENLVYVMGLSPRIADNDILKKPEYFGKFGKILKVAVGVASASQSSLTAYVTYGRAEEALRAIQAVNNVSVEGRTVKASLGTTKYCSSYLRNQTCHKPDCMYLHDLAKDEASFTKEDMQVGKHTDYERRLHEAMLSSIVPKAPPSAANGQEKEEPPSTAESSLNSSVHSQLPNGHPPEPPPPPPPAPSEPASAAPPRRGKGKKKSSEEEMNRILAAISAQASSQTAVYSTDTATFSQLVEEETDPGPPPGIFAGPTPPPPSAHFRIGGTPSTTSLDDSQSSATSARQKKAPERSQSNKGEVHVQPTRLGGGLGLDVGTDWQAAFGLKPASSAPSFPESRGMEKAADAHPHLPASLFDDDALGFDPFSESSKGLADLLEEEERERTSKRRPPYGSPSSSSSIPRPNGFPQPRLGSNWGQPPSGASSVGSISSLGGHPRTGVVSPSTLMGAAGRGLKPGSLPSSDGPSPHSYTTPPPGFPPIHAPHGFDGSFPPQPPPGGHTPNGMRPPPGFGPPGFPPAPPPFRDPSPRGFHHPHPQHHHQAPPPPGEGLFNMQEWQDGLKNLLPPNVNVHFAPSLGAGNAKPPQHGGNWGRGSSVGSGLPPFHQPPPPLSISTGGGGGGGMRPSPPGDLHPYRMPPPPMNGHPRPPPPPGFAPGGNGNWNCLTPPPPGFSPRQH